MAGRVGLARWPACIAHREDPGERPNIDAQAHARHRRSGIREDRRCGRRTPRDHGAGRVFGPCAGDDRARRRAARGDQHADRRDGAAAGLSLAARAPAGAGAGRLRCARGLRRGLGRHGHRPRHHAGIRHDADRRGGGLFDLSLRAVGALREDRRCGLDRRLLPTVRLGVLSIGILGAALLGLPGSRSWAVFDRRADRRGGGHALRAAGAPAGALSHPRRLAPGQPRRGVHGRGIPGTLARARRGAPRRARAHRAPRRALGSGHLEPQSDLAARPYPRPRAALGHRSLRRAPHDRRAWPQRGRSPGSG